MSMFGAVDLSTLAPSRGATGAAGAGKGEARPGGVPGNTAGAQSGAHASGAWGSEEAAEGTVLPAPLVVDVDATNLRDVAQISTQVPVVVVLHTPRSDASTELVSTLEDLAVSYEGRFELAKVDVDAAPEVAQALQATAVPTVLALIAGQPMPLFQGTIPTEQLRSLLEQLLSVAASHGLTCRVSVGDQETPNVEPEETPVQREAREAIDRGDFEAAIAVYDHALAQAPADTNLKIAREHTLMLARMDGKDPQELLAAAAAAPDDVDAALAAADAAFAVGDIDGALGRALEAVRAHEGDERERARVRLLELFDLVGQHTPEVARARRHLATLLF